MLEVEYRHQERVLGCCFDVIGSGPDRYCEERSCSVHATLSALAAVMCDARLRCNGLSDVGLFGIEGREFVATYVAFRIAAQLRRCRSRDGGAL